MRTALQGARTFLIGQPGGRPGWPPIPQNGPCYGPDVVCEHGFARLPLRSRPKTSPRPTKAGAVRKAAHRSILATPRSIASASLPTRRLDDRGCPSSKTGSKDWL